MALDQTSDSIEERRFLNRHMIELKKELKYSHFSLDEATAVALIYYKIIKNENEHKPMSAQCFSSILHTAFGMADDALMDRIFYAFHITSFVPLSTWLHAISLFLRGTLPEKMQYCFKIYDLNSSKMIRRDQIVNLLRKSVFKHHEEEIEESVKDLADIILKKMDLDNDGVVGWLDYTGTVVEQPLMLEFAGQCLPNRSTVYTFLTTFTDKIGRF